MNKLFICLSFNMLLGCGANKNGALFLKEEDKFITDLKGNNCTESGYQVVQAPNGEHYRLITFYSNCDVRVDRKMKEFEPKQWGIKPKGAQ